MARQYPVRDGESSFSPSAGRREVRTNGLGQRHWAVLAVLAEHGALHTGQVTVLLFGSRPAAVRHLRVLVEAGLVWRFVHDNDPRHLAYYELSIDGRDAVSQRLQSAGRQVPVALGQPGRNQLAINAFFVGLVEHARCGEGELVQWRRALEAALWLRQHGVPYGDPDAYGVWVEGDRAVRFLLHVDTYFGPSLLGGPVPPGGPLVDYWEAAAGVPVTALLMICARDRERDLHTDRDVAELPVAVASTTHDRLAATSPAEAVWSRVGTGPDVLVRLIDLADR